MTTYWLLGEEEEKEEVVEKSEECGALEANLATQSSNILHNSGAASPASPPDCYSKTGSEST